MVRPNGFEEMLTEYEIDRKRALPLDVGKLALFEAHADNARTGFEILTHERKQVFNDGARTIYEFIDMGSRKIGSRILQTVVHPMKAEGSKPQNAELTLYVAGLDLQDRDLAECEGAIGTYEHVHIGTRSVDFQHPDMQNPSESSLARVQKFNELLWSVIDVRQAAAL